MFLAIRLINKSDPQGTHADCDGADDGCDFSDCDGDTISCMMADGVYGSTGILASATATSTATCAGDWFWNPAIQGCDAPAGTGLAATELFSQIGNKLGGFDGMLGVASVPYLIPAGMGVASGVVGALGAQAGRSLARRLLLVPCRTR